MIRLIFSLMLLIAMPGFAGSVSSQDYDFTGFSEWTATQLPRCSAHPHSGGECTVSLAYFVGPNERRYCGAYVTGPAYCYQMRGTEHFSFLGGTMLWSYLPAQGVNRPQQREIKRRNPA